MFSISLAYTLLLLKTMRAQSSGLFSGFLLLTILISRPSAAVCSLLFDVAIGGLLLVDFLLIVNNWLLVLCRSLLPLKGQARSWLAYSIVCTLFLLVYTAFRHVLSIIFYK